jgi:hypothetical protein
MRKADRTMNSGTLEGPRDGIEFGICTGSARAASPPHYKARF